jgi:hypothetical protein
MKSSNLLALLMAVLLAGCGGGTNNSSSSSSGPGNNGGSGSAGAAPNVLAVTVNDPSYPNKPTVSVTVCTPGTSNCRTINNVLLDTGAFGLRIFRQALSGISLPQVTVDSLPLAECIAYLDGSGNWGPVQTADIVLGGETASNIPIQVIDAGYFAGAIPSQCKPPNIQSLDQDPGSAGFNGILGAGLFAQDCGHGCVNSANNGIYFTCSGATCTPAAVPLSSQVQNPVAHVQQDNNGVIVQLPGVSLGGVKTLSGQLILGIGTQSNNTPSGVTVYPANASGDITTVFNGQTLAAFIDSGSNGLFFNDSSLPVCPSPNQDWYCVQPNQTLSATNAGYAGSPSGSVSFTVGSALNLFQNASNGVFVELAGPAPAGSIFDWGLPFFFGRTVVVGIEGTSSTLGAGPYWAY